MKANFLILLFLAQSCMAQEKVISKMNNTEQKEMLNSILNNERNKHDKSFAFLLDSVNINTHIVSIYHAYFDKEKFEFTDDPEDFLEIEYHTYYLYNRTDSTASVFASVNQLSSSGLSKDYGYLLNPLVLDDEPIVKTALSVSRKIDLERSCVFDIIDSRGRRVYVLSDKKIYIIEGGELIEFNTYYKSKCTIEEFKASNKMP